MTKHSTTMSGIWPFHDKTDRYSVWGFTISWQSTLPLCLGLNHFMTKHTADIVSVYFVLKWSIPRHSISLFVMNGQSPDIVSVCFVMKWSSPRHFHDKTHWNYVWGLTIHDKQTDAMCRDWPFQDKIHNGQTLHIISVCFVMNLSSPRHSISLCCHEMVKPQI
jgi:hypothetical protein